jgi:spore maturation protein SpmA
LIQRTISWQNEVPSCEGGLLSLLAVNTSAVALCALCAVAISTLCAVAARLCASLLALCALSTLCALLSCLIVVASARCSSKHCSYYCQ